MQFVAKRSSILGKVQIRKVKSYLMLHMNVSELVGGQCDVTASGGAGANTYTSNDRYCGATFQWVKKNI